MQKKRGLILINRPKKYLGKCTISDLAPYLIKFMKEKHVCYLMNTSPLLKTSTLQKAVNVYERLNLNKFDGLKKNQLTTNWISNRCHKIYEMYSNMFPQLLLCQKLGY